MEELTKTLSLLVDITNKYKIARHRAATRKFTLYASKISSSYVKSNLVEIK